MTVDLLLVDDQPLVREGLRCRLESMGNFRVIGEADTADDAIRLTAAFAPNLAVLDIGSCGMSGIELTCSLRKTHPPLAVLVLTMFDSDECILRAVRAGVSGYVLKNSPVQQIVTAIQTVASGGTYYSSTAMGALSRGSTQSLSRREREVLAHVVNGYSNKETAKLLNLSVRTVETHRETIRRKLGAESALDLVRRAVHMGLVNIQSEQ